MHSKMSETNIVGNLTKSLKGTVESSMPKLKESYKFIKSFVLESTGMEERAYRYDVIKIQHVRTPN